MLKTHVIVSPSYKANIQHNVKFDMFYVNNHHLHIDFERINYKIIFNNIFITKNCSFFSRKCFCITSKQKMKIINTCKTTVSFNLSNQKTV